MKYTQKITFFIFTIVFCSFLASCSKPGDSLVTQAGDAFYSRQYTKTISLLNDALEKGITFSPEYVYVMMSKAYLAQGDYTNATETLEKAMQTRPEYMELISLGMCYLTLKDYDKAEETYKRAVQLRPAAGEAYASLGAVYIDKNQPLLALENLKKAVELLPKYNIVHANLAVAYAMNGDSTNATLELQKAQDLNCPNIDEFKLKCSKLLTD